MGYIWQDFEEYLLSAILIGVFYVCAGCCTINPNFRPPPSLFHLEEFSSPPAYYDPPFIWDLRVGFQLLDHRKNISVWNGTRSELLSFRRPKRSSSSRDAFTHGPTGPGPRGTLKFLDLGGSEQNRKTSQFQVPLQTYLATISTKIHANRVLGTMHVTQNLLGVFQGAQIKSGPKAPSDLNAALSSSSKSTKHTRDFLFLSLSYSYFL